MRWNKNWKLSITFFFLFKIWSRFTKTLLFDNQLINYTVSFHSNIRESPMLHYDVLRDSQPIRPYLHTVGNGLTEEILSILNYPRLRLLWSELSPLFDLDIVHRYERIPLANRKDRVRTQSLANCPLASSSSRVNQANDDRKKRKWREKYNGEHRKREWPRDGGSPHRIGVRSTD